MRNCLLYFVNCYFVNWHETKLCLQQARLHVFNERALCSIVAQFNSSRFYCAWDEATASAASQANVCYGDSGGPLLHYDGPHARWLVYGVTSFIVTRGDVCDRSEMYNCSKILLLLLLLLFKKKILLLLSLLLLVLF